MVVGEVEAWVGGQRVCNAGIGRRQRRRGRKQQLGSGLDVRRVQPGGLLLQAPHHRAGGGRRGGLGREEQHIRGGGGRGRVQGGGGCGGGAHDEAREAAMLLLVVMVLRSPNKDLVVLRLHLGPRRRLFGFAAAVLVVVRAADLPLETVVVVVRVAAGTAPGLAVLSEALGEGVVVDL